METTTTSLLHKSKKTPDGNQYGRDAEDKLGFYGADPVVQPSTTGETTGSTANTNATDATFTGDVGSTAYTVGDIVKHLKNLGLIAE